ncbi:hypothetical protein C2845_PM13G05150 [Panicum miliaceum]|uniref:KIB1-4 beta-propeller domain-containing protein n=1 Tax=Panicum miliaceum TaxID=4540 RepID=A0A3L6RFH2_PANMI|nr:hypothetical protein C2845_PM13G05150 [Panicum miliaceum]
MAAAAMFAKLSDKFGKYVCGISPTTTPDEDRYKAGLRSLLLLPPSPERQPRRSPSTPEDDDDDDDDVTATVSPGEPRTELDREEEMASTLPCLAFASENGYRLFSLAEMRMLDDPRPPMPPVPGRRLVPSPYGGTVLATDVCYRHPCHLVDPFTGARAPLPDLPVPFSEREPVAYHPDDEPRPRRARATDDGLAWDWSPRGVMVARGDTAFFRAHGGGGEWTPVHQSARGSPMTVNYRGGRFFLLELRTLETTVVDAATLRARARIPAPAGPRDVDAAYLAPSSAGDAVLLVQRAGDSRGMLFTEAYRARDRGGGGGLRWARAHDIGDRAVFVDGAHAFTVAAGPAGALANHVYVVLASRVARPCGRLAVAYDVGFADLTRPECMGRLRLDVGEVEPMWGQPHWIIRRDGADRHHQLGRS